jgi:hypothetical protein
MARPCAARLLEKLAAGETCLHQAIAARTTQPFSLSSRESRVHSGYSPEIPDIFGSEPP